MGPGFDPPGKAMAEKVVAAPAPGSPNTTGLTEGAGDGTRCLPSSDKAQAPMGRRGRAAIIDFGRNKIFAVTDDSDEVLVFNNLTELVEKLRPAVIVLDSLPGKFQETAAELAKTGIMFLRLKDLKKLSEERENNGVKKSDENDVVMLKTLFRRNPDIFQPLFETPEELIVRELTEEWATFTLMKKVSKQKRTTANHPLAIKAHRTLQNIVDEFSEEIHREAMKLPLYRLAFEQLGLKGPTLAYLLGHDGWALKTLPREKLIFRFQMTGRRRYKGRKTRSKLLIMLAMSVILNKHPRYLEVYRRYFEKFKTEGNSGKKAYWKAILRVAERILRDLHSLAKNTKQTPDT
jgi:hypothetical protein